MSFDVTPLIPVIGTVAAALVAGGIARANLIASKESKISEFRQAWINALRDDLAALFSNTRTLARAVQESRALQPATPDKLHIEQSKITAVRHGAAETYHRIRLRLNGGQPDHKDLLRLLGVMMGAQQAYMTNKEGNVGETIAAVETAASYAEGVLKTEWDMVKLGERAYRESVRATKYTLIGSFAVLAVLVVGIPIYVYSSATEQVDKPANKARIVPQKAAPEPLPPAAYGPATTSNQPVT